VRSMTNRRKAFLSVAVSVGLLAAACGDDSDETDPSAGDESEENEAEENGGDGGGSDLSGNIDIDGSSTVGPLSEVAAELFMEENPGVQVAVAISGTSGGFEKFCNGETDGNNASREIKEEEIDLCESNDIAYDNVQVANDALSLVVNADNPVECITVEQANQMWDEGSTVSSWSEVDDLDADFDADLTLYGPGTDSGTFDFFTEVINGEEGRIRTDYVDIGEDDNAAVTGVEGDEGAMGLIPYSYLQEAGDAVQALEIDGGDGCVEATLDNVQEGSYVPLGRPLFTYASDLALERPETVAFLQFTVENSEEIADIAGFVPMNEDQQAEALAAIEALAG
jgi:phosphate transport system substrate-binding protein